MTLGFHTALMVCPDENDRPRDIYLSFMSWEHGAQWTITPPVLPAVSHEWGQWDVGIGHNTSAFSAVYIWSPQGPIGPFTVTPPVVPPPDQSHRGWGPTPDYNWKFAQLGKGAS